MSPLEARSAYFTVLKAEKLLKVTQETEKQIAAQKDVANNFYEVGMSPLNDLLQAQVELANAMQEVILAKNDLQESCHVCHKNPASTGADGEVPCQKP